jgi:hypothetical protein
MILLLPLGGLLLRLRHSIYLLFPQPYPSQSLRHLLMLFLTLLLSIHLWTLFPPLPAISSCMQISKPSLDLQAIGRVTLLQTFIHFLRIITKIIPEGVSFVCK